MADKKDGDVDMKPADAAPAAAAGAATDAPAAAAATDDADKSDAKAKKSGKKAKADGKKTLKEKQSEAETLEEDPKKNLGAPVEIIESKRRTVKTAVKAFTPDYTGKTTKSVDVPKGDGTALGDIENVEKALKKLKGKDEETKALHRLLFGVPGTALTRVRHIKAFNGFATENADDTKDKKLTSLNGMKLDMIKTLAGVVDVETSGTKEEVADRIVEFLFKPKASGRAFKFSKSGAAGKKRKATKSPKKGKSDKDKKPRAPTSFMMFSAAKRAEVKEKHPDKSITEISKVLGEMWRGLSEAKQAEWKAKAEAAGPGGASGKSKSKSKSKDKSKSKSKSKDKSKDKKKKKSKKSDSESESESESEASSSSESESEPESEEEDKKKKKKKSEKSKSKSPKKEKSKSSKSKSPKKEKSSKEKSSKKSKDDGESESKPNKKQKTEKAAAEKVDDAPAVDDKMRAAIRELVKSGGDDVSVKSVLTELKAKFGDKTVDAQKPQIKELITKIYDELSSKK